MEYRPHTFSLSIQRAGDDPVQAIPMGIIDYSSFVKRIEQFPWAEELEKANQTPEKAFPAFSVKDRESLHYLWVSAYGLPDQFEFLVGYIFPEENPLSANDTYWEEVYATRELQEVRGVYFDFFEREFHRLSLNLKRLDLYGASGIDHIIH